MQRLFKVEKQSLLTFLLASIFQHNVFCDITDAQNVKVGDIRDRKNLINELKCFSFQWYIDNVYPDAPFPNHHKYLGQVKAFLYFPLYT